jgi:hypothetical protein
MADRADVYQVLLETLARYKAEARVSQTMVEYTNKCTNPPTRASQTMIEYINKASLPAARASQVIIEVINGTRRVRWYTDEASAVPFAF